MLLFLFYTWMWFFSMFCRFLDRFALTLTLNECILTSHDAPELPSHGRKKEQKNVEQVATTDGPLMATVCGGPFSPDAICFLTSVQLLGSFNSIITCGCLTSSIFTRKRVVFSFDPSSHPIPLSIIHYLD